jgi:flagellar basal body-associated protein FliL
MGGILFSVGLVLGFVFWIGGGELNEEAMKNPFYQAQQSIRPRPSYRELSPMYLFEEKRVFNLKRQKDSDVTMLQIDNIEMICFNTVPGIKNPVQVVELYKNQIRELVSIYFQGVSPTTIIPPEGREGAKLELLKKINDLLQINEETDSDLIYNIIIENWIYV